ncbi:MAG: hypothetical protein U9Q03_00585 [Patescibacteria group bacterium]|nr:hypothetical protein [Patescibacteria group bacterium]
MPITDDEDELDEELSTIYGDEGDGEAETYMSHLERAPRLTARKIIVGLIAFLAALATISWVGFFVFSPQDDKFSGDRVSLVIEGPDAPKSGEVVTYRLKYRNGENVPLGTASLEIRLPDTFTLTESAPEMDHNSWKLGSLPPRGHGEVSFSGIFLAPIGKEHDIQAIATYRPADFNSEFQKVSTKTIIIDGSVLEVDIEGPSKALPGDTVDLTITYENTSDTRFEDLVVITKYPSGFIAESSDPGSSDETISEWRIGELGAKGIDSIKVTGTFASDAHGDLEIGAKIGYLDGSDVFQPQVETSFVPKVLQGQLVTTVILNGKAESQAIRFGDTLRYAITFRNTGAASLGNVEFTLVLESKPESGLILWNELEDEAEGTRDGDRITWTPKQIESLSRLEGDDEGVIEISVPIAGDPPGGIGDGEFDVSCWVESNVESIDGDVVDRSSRTQPLVAKVLSDTELTVFGRFYDDNGIPVGSGKIPPEVGETTTYRVSWRITNSLHELSDLKLSAKLPDNVAWTGGSDVDAGDLRFDAADRKLIWTLNWLPTTIEDINISFDVSITPDEDQQGKIPTLVDATILEATDKIAGEKIIISNPPITTSLEEDPHGAGKGRVK